MNGDRDQFKDRMKETDELQRTLENREQLLRASKVDEPPGDAPTISPKSVVVNWQKSKIESRSSDRSPKSGEKQKKSYDDQKRKEETEKRKEETEKRKKKAEKGKEKKY